MYPALLARLGIVSRSEAEEAFEIAVPAMVTGGIRTILRATDFFLISLALGDAAVAGIEFGFQYYFIGFGLALGISSGTISVVARAKGAGDDATADLAVKQSLWIALAICLPLTVATWFWAEGLVGLLTHDARTIAYGGAYLRIVMLAVVCRFWSMIAARALQGAGDARTPMLVRLLTIPTNLVLDAVLIFGLGPFPRMGVAGAALGTAIANTLAAVLFFGVLVSGKFPVRLNLSGPHWDGRLMREILRVGFPLAGTQLFRTLGRFPFLFILGSIGTPIVAAYAIGRRVVLLALMPAWGFATAASTLVGQSLGGRDADGAARYGWQTLRLAFATQTPIAVVLFFAAGPIAGWFGTGYPALTAAFMKMFAIGVLAFSVARTMQGALRGAGDPLWPLWGTAAGTVLRLAVAVLAPTAGAMAVRFGGWTFAPGLGWGLPAIYAAILVDFSVRAGVNLVRFRSGAWKTVSARAFAG